MTWVRLSNREYLQRAALSLCRLAGLVCKKKQKKNCLVVSFREEFCEIFRAKDRTTMKMYTCKKFLKKDGRKVRKAAKNEILILKM